jgi:hypothetical protein
MIETASDAITNGELDRGDPAVSSYPLREEASFSRLV